MFKTLGREHHEKAKGAKLMDVHMEPGDLLYLPRGQYHDALADEGGTMHIAFGITYPIGMDVMTFLFDRVVAEPEFRANLPRPAPRRPRPCRIAWPLLATSSARSWPSPDRSADRGAATRFPVPAPCLQPA